MQIKNNYPDFAVEKRSKLLFFSGVLSSNQSARFKIQIFENFKKPIANFNKLFDKFCDINIFRNISLSDYLDYPVSLFQALKLFFWLIKIQKPENLKTV